jgi:hypothetical protein
VADDLHTQLSTRAHAVADLAVDAVLERAEELAKRWVIALIRTSRLDGLGELPLDELAREGPSLCAQMVRAVQSEVELERLTGRGAPSGREQTAVARRLAKITGAPDTTALVEAVEALRGVLWEALGEQLREPSARQVGDVCDRLAYVCSAALATAVGHTAMLNRTEPAQQGEVTIEPPAPGEGRVTGPPYGEHPATIVDERPGSPVEVAPPSGTERPLSWDESPPAPAGARATEIEIRDERGEDGEQGPAAWIRSIGGQLERFAQDRLPFAVLLVELVEIERLRGATFSAELSELDAALELALTAALGTGAGSLTGERPGRYWLLAQRTDRAGARGLAERVAREVASYGDRLSPRLQVAIGTAVCPEDAREAAALAAHADVGLYADRSAVRSSGARMPMPVDEPA